MCLVYQDPHGPLQPPGAAAEKEARPRQLA